MTAGWPRVRIFSAQLASQAANPRDLPGRLHGPHEQGGACAKFRYAGLAIRYPIGYTLYMGMEHLLIKARQAAGLSQAAFAKRARTSRPTLSAYEHGRKSPTLETAARIVGEAGFDLALEPRIEFVEAAVERGRPIMVPTRLPRLNLDEALATVELPLHLNWSERGRVFNLRDRRQRARVYEIILREGGPADVRAYIDGALLADLWAELVLPVAVRNAWQMAVVGAPAKLAA